MSSKSAELPEPLRQEVDEKWQALQEALDVAGITLSGLSDLTPVLWHVFAFSDFVSRSLIRQPHMLADLVTSGDLQHAFAPDRFQRLIQELIRDVVDEFSLIKGLRALRLREMVRIAWRDLSGWADLTETLIDLTALADACLDGVSSTLYQWQADEQGYPMHADGTPQQLVVLGMGKLGGKELNFSSDIDLIFAFPSAGKTDQEITCDDFFTRLCRRLVKVLSVDTPEGRVFRVDTGLRPYGDSGPMAMSFDAMETYYQIQGREWERYALIKARSVAGARYGDELLSRLRPFVYRRYLDFGIYETLRDMKARIMREVRAKGMRRNIKLGPGGIREIEFFCHVFQLIRGGVRPDLRTQNLQRALHMLTQHGYISDGVYTRMVSAYRFLRRVENRLQAFRDQQVHTLPTDALGSVRLARAMGFEDPDTFERCLLTHMGFVQEQFEGLLAMEEGGHPDGQSTSQSSDLAGIWQGQSNGTRSHEILSAMGYGDPPAVMAILRALREDTATRALSLTGRRRLDHLMPKLIQCCAEAAHPDTTLARLTDLVCSIQRRTSYLSLLLENPSVLIHLTRLADASPWLTSFLARHPVLLDELLDPRHLYTPTRKEALVTELAQRLESVQEEDLEYQIETLCIFKQVNVLRVAAADVTGTLALMRVSDYLTAIAEVVLAAVVEMAWRHLVARHGHPRCRLDDNPIERGFAIIGYGKLGGFELGYGSDLDLVFLHAADSGMTEGGSHPIDNALFFTRLGQRVLHILTAHTRAGRLYEADMRLRPDGGSGLVVSHVNAFEEYQINKAWTWEHQALVRARAITGDPQMCEHFAAIRCKVLSRPREPVTLQGEVVAMRERLRREDPVPQKGFFDIKQGPGGIVDIEFLVQYLVLLQSSRHPELLEWTDNIRILQTLIETGGMDNLTADRLKHAYLILRAHAHKLSLQSRAALLEDHAHRMLRKRVQGIWQRYIVT